MSIKLWVKKVTTLLAICGLTAFMVMPAMADTTASNLIANPGVESSVSGTPNNWTPESWGSNTASFSYLNTGHTGSHAIQTTVSNYSDGDAKWIFDPVSVAAGSQYTYTDWYESSATTNIWVQYTSSDGTSSYQWLGSVGASATWVQSTMKFTVPAGATSASVFHVLNANGQLTIDDASMSSVATCTTSDTNGIYDGGFEETCPGNPGMPANWNTETFGSPGASFAYTTDAHSGNHAVRATVADSGGEAGWQTDWQSAVSDQRYGLTFWHDDSTYIYAYVAIRLNDGSLQYISLMSAPSTQNTGWSQYSDNFVTPDNTSSIQITIATSGVGAFNLDDVYLNSLADQAPPDFSQGMVTVTLDDGDASTYSNGFPVLKSDGIKGTFYINAGTLGTSGYMTKANVQTLAANGQEIGSHLYQHLDMVTLTNANLQQQITNNNNALHTILGNGYNVGDFASPYGSYTSSTLDTVMQYYQSHRTTDGQFNSKANFNPRQVHAILVNSSTTVAQVEAWINQAKQDHEWLVLVYHAVGSSPSGGDGSGYATTPAHFKTEMNYLHSSGATTLPTNSALASLEAQL